jgi:two-component system, NarL family, sensor histidine kinase UhpB
VATSDAQRLSAPDGQGPSAPLVPRLPGSVGEQRPKRALRERWGNASLLWRVFLANAVVWIAAFALLAWAPVTIHRVATPRELVILAIGLVAMLAIVLVLLRRVLGPLRRLASLMRAVVPGQPGLRAEPPGAAGGEVVALAEALNSMLDRLEDERRESGRRALVAQESERARVARELHDGVGQTLTAVALRAEQAAGRPSGQGEVLGEIAQTVLQSLEDVHRIGRELRPEALDDLGLVNALIVLSSQAGRQSGIRVRRNLDRHLPALSRDVELVIYRVAQEALTNALRHAECTEVTVSLASAEDRVLLTVGDNGRGLPQHRREGGLAGMRERAMLIGGELEIRSRRSRGTEIFLRAPVTAEPR